MTDGAKPIDFAITENGKIVDLTDKAHSIYNQIKRGDIEGVKIGAGTHKRLADVPFRITSKTTGENHVVVTDDNGQFSTSADWASHKHNTNAGKTSKDGEKTILAGKEVTIVDTVKKPEVPKKPETPQTPKKPNRPSDSPKTGDSTNLMAFLVMLLISGGGLAGTFLYKRRKMKHS